MPLRGLQYPGSYAELRAWFPDDESLYGLLGLAALADGAGVPELRTEGHDGGRRPGVALRRMP